MPRPQVNHRFLAAFPDPSYYRRSGTRALLVLVFGNALKLAPGVFFTGRLLWPHGARSFFGLSFRDFPERAHLLGCLVRRVLVNRPRDFPKCRSFGESLVPNCERALSAGTLRGEGLRPWDISRSHGIRFQVPRRGNPRQSCATDGLRPAPPTVHEPDGSLATGQSKTLSRLLCVKVESPAPTVRDPFNSQLAVKA